MKYTNFVLVFIIGSYFKLCECSFDNCPIYTCNQLINKTTTNCLQVTRTGNLLLNYTFTSCENKDEFCPFNETRVYNSGDSENCIKKKAQVENLIHGQYCQDDLECLSKNCRKGKCQGFEEKKECIDDRYCAGALYCHKIHKNCTKQIDPKDLTLKNYICLDDYECQNSHICQFGKCVRPYTLNDGEVTNNPKMCKSGKTSSIISGTTLTSVCDSYLLINSDLACGPNQLTCKYKWQKSNFEFEQNCICSKTTNGLRFCPPDFSDKFRNEDAFKFITLDKANTRLRQISDWEGIHNERFYPNTGMDICVAKVLNNGLFLVFSKTALLIIAVILLFV